MKEMLLVVLVFAMFACGWMTVWGIGTGIDRFRRTVRRGRKRTMLLLDSPPQMRRYPGHTLLAALLRLSGK